MRLLTALRISAAGLAAQRARIDAAASNLANLNTTRTPQGGPYRRVDPVLRAVPSPESPGTASVVVDALVQDPGPGRKVYQPDHPDADADGFVVLPDIDPTREMVNLLGAQRSYEANAAALETFKAMARRALDLLR
jgi:flagellar basal-body rod protein FlgC